MARISQPVNLAAIPRRLRRFSDDDELNATQILVQFEEDQERNRRQYPGAPEICDHVFLWPNRLRSAIRREDQTLDLLVQPTMALCQDVYLRLKLLGDKDLPSLSIRHSYWRSWRFARYSLAIPNACSSVSWSIGSGLIHAVSYGICSRSPAASQPGSR